MIPQDCAGFWVAFKAHPGICDGGCNAKSGRKNKKDVALFFSTGLTFQL
jgi:hypothetical protein